MILNQQAVIAALDGRPDELDLNVDASLMPVVSDSYRNLMTWNGTREEKPDPYELERLKKFIMHAHQQKKKVRLWGAPDTPQFWQFALDIGIDLINTDILQDLHDFLVDQEK